MYKLNNDLEKDFPNIKDLPAGEYVCKLQDIRERQDKNSITYFEFLFVVAEGDEKNSVLQDRLYFFDKNIYDYDDTARKRTAIAFSKVRDLKKATRIEANDIADFLKFKDNLIIVVDINDVDGKKYNNLSYKPIAKTNLVNDEIPF